MTIESTRPNYYTLLGLHPDEKWDQTKFEQALRDKRIEWSRQGNGVAKKALLAKQNLARLPDIQQVMQDETLREAEAKAARADLASGRKAELDRFDHELAYFNAKEYVEQSELDAFVKEFQGVLPDKEILARVKVSVKTLASAVPSTPQLDSTTARSIEDNLAPLGIADLYALLDRPNTTASAELSRAAEKLSNEMISRQPKTAEVTAQATLAGHALRIFKDEDLRKRYDETLRLHSLNMLLKAIETTVNRSTEKEVNEKQARTFLTEARKAGWSNEIALAKLKEHARTRKWLLQLPTLDKEPQGERCGNCHEINGPERNFCRRCNKELMTNCPSCGSKVATDDAGCGKCGFSVGNRYWVDTLLERAAASHDLDQMRDLLREAEDLWRPTNPDARIQKINQYKNTLQQSIQGQQRNLEQLRQLTDRRHFYAARDFLALHADDIADYKTQRQNSERKIAEAQTLLQRAQGRATSREERMQLCLQALRICADYQDARDLLKSMPPAPPKNLRARPGGAIINLTWDASSTADVSYRVLRKTQAQPVSAQDGVILGTVSGAVYDDTNPECGLPLYYAAFAEYEGVLSTQGALLREPVFLTRDVEHETVEVNNQQVQLSWQAPPHVANVIVVRKEQSAPGSIDDGKRLSVVHPSRLVDRDVQNEHTYYYRIYCQFQDHLGKLITTAGKTVYAVPETPPAPIMQMNISHSKASQGYKIQLNWVKPAKGRVVVLKSERAVPIKAGTVIQAAQLKDYGQVLEGQQDGLSDMWLHPGMGYYLPVVLFGNMAYIGEASRYACIDDVSDVQYENLGTTLRLQWSWPQRCQEAMVSYSYDGWPQADSTSVITRHITRAEYDSYGHFDLREAPNRDYYIVVAAIIRQGNEQITGLGTRIRARLASKVVVTYEIKQTGFLGRRKRILAIHARKPGALPTLLLVSSRGRLPLQKTEGDLFYRLEGPMSIESELSIELPDKSFPQRTFGKLYLEDDTAYDVVTIHHPGEEKLRLG